MKKILIKETQFNNLKKQLKEQSSLNDSYSKTVRVDVWGSSEKIKYHGYEINDFNTSNIDIMFDILDERREWGIKTLEIYNIRGPKFIEIEVDYYIDDDTQKEAMIQLPLDWENNLETNKINGTGAITVGDNLEIELIQGKNGKIIPKMTIDVESV